MSGIDDARLKLARAETHAADFRVKSGEALEADPYPIRYENDPSTRRYTAWGGPAGPIDPRLSTIVGDAVNNARAALDYLIYDLSNAEGKKRSGFPICRTADEFATKSAVLLAGVKSPIVAAVRRSQPFARGDQTLAILNALWNWDKHKRLSLMSTIILDDLLEVFESEGIGDLELFGGFAHKERKLLTFTVLDGFTNINVQSQLPFGIAFAEDGPGRGKNVLTFLDNANRLIGDEIIPAFEAFF